MYAQREETHIQESAGDSLSIVMRRTEQAAASGKPFAPTLALE